MHVNKKSSQRRRAYCIHARLVAPAAFIHMSTEASHNGEHRLVNQARRCAIVPCRAVPVQEDSAATRRKKTRTKHIDPFMVLKQQCTKTTNRRRLRQAQTIHRPRPSKPPTSTSATAEPSTSASRQPSPPRPACALSEARTLRRPRPPPPPLLPPSSRALLTSPPVDSGDATDVR